MNANLVFQADLLINAEIMTELGSGNASAQAIVERWDSMTHDAVYLEGAAQVYTASGYFDAVNTARSSGTSVSYTHLDVYKRQPSPPGSCRATASASRR